MEERRRSSSRRVQTDEEIAEDLGDLAASWSCCGCIFSGQSSEPNTTTTEDLTPSRSSTNPTDISSLNEFVEVGSLNPEQQAPSQMSDIANARKCSKCLRWFFMCLNPRAQKPNDQPTPSTDLSPSLTREGIVMDNLRQGQTAGVMAPQRDPADGMESIDAKEDSVEEAVDLQGEHSKQEMTDSKNSGSPEPMLETTV